MLVPQSSRYAALAGGIDAPADVSKAHLVLVPAAPAVAAPDEDQSTALRRQAFGPRLKALRERRGVTLDAISHTTKVSASLLDALERGDVSHWPKGIYRRAFFREYLGAIGLPAEPHFSEFLVLFPDGEDRPATLADAHGDGVAPLRLTLAPAPRWQLARARLLRELLNLAAVLILTSALAWSMNADLLTFAAMIGLCYYLPVTTEIVSRITGRPAGRPLRGSEPSSKP
jgi:transcriptional regulator with XRE-family HTH domain